MLFFSATGNSKYIAESFSRYMGTECYSIEDELDFEALISAEETVGFCYPIYYSRVPRIMREFAVRYMDLLMKKKLIIFCTQQILSGDGARAFTYAFPRKSTNVIYAEHFFMPSNIWPVATNTRKIAGYAVRAERKMQAVCRNIENGVIVRRGFNPVSQGLGLIQAPILPVAERKALDSINISDDCSQCRICVSSCPMNNLAYEDGQISHKHNCTICYRCVNICPQKAIAVGFSGSVNKQYKGIV